MYALRTLHTKNREESYDTFVAGLVGGYTVFGRGIQSSVNQQIVIYVFARVMLALAKMSVSGPGRGGLKGLVPEDFRGKATRNAWPVFASLSWAMAGSIWVEEPCTAIVAAQTISHHHSARISDTSAPVRR